MNGSCHELLICERFICERFVCERFVMKFVKKFVVDEFVSERSICEPPIQAIPYCRDAKMQTDWKYPKNAAVQYVPRVFTDEELLEIDESESYRDFIVNATRIG